MSKFYESMQRYMYDSIKVCSKSSAMDSEKVLNELEKLKVTFLYEKVLELSYDIMNKWPLNKL